MRTWILTEKHPALEMKCAKCGFHFKAGDSVTLVCMRPADQEQVEKAEAGRVHIVVGDLAHERCATV